MIGTAEANAITITTTANSLPLIFPRNCRIAEFAREILKESLQAGVNTPALVWGKRLLVSLRLEAKVDRLGFAACDGYVLLLRAVVFMPRGDLILARRQVRQCERAIVLADRVVVGLEHHEPAVHPRMDVALHRNKLRRV